MSRCADLSTHTNLGCRPVYSHAHSPAHTLTDAGTHRCALTVTPPGTHRQMCACMGDPRGTCTLTHTPSFVHARMCTRIEKHSGSSLAWRHPLQGAPHLHTWHTEARTSLKSESRAKLRSCSAGPSLPGSPPPRCRTELPGERGGGEARKKAGGLCFRGYVPHAGSGATLLLAWSRELRPGRRQRHPARAGQGRAPGEGVRRAPARRRHPPGGASRPPR